MQTVQYADLPYFIVLATVTIYIGAHRGLTQRIRQQISLREVLLSRAATGTAHSEHL